MKKKITTALTVIGVCIVIGFSVHSLYWWFRKFDFYSWAMFIVAIVCLLAILGGGTVPFAIMFVFCIVCLVASDKPGDTRTICIKESEKPEIIVKISDSVPYLVDKEKICITYEDQVYADGKWRKIAR